jgi:ABC-type bacteriocin/lantibiotic exporter with double-glycine peptidase domain
MHHDRLSVTLTKMKILCQRFFPWSNETIGQTKVRIADKGCTITCLSMLSDWYGNFRTPDWIAKNLSFTNAARVYWNSMNGKLPFRFVYRYYRQNDAKIKEILSSKDNACLLEVNNNHWVVLVGYSKIYGYKVADPYYGDTIYLSKRKYRITGFTEVARS